MEKKNTEKSKKAFYLNLYTAPINNYFLQKNILLTSKRFQKRACGIIGYEK
tara:strand:- start:1430 stop:1582 length:153 start_codon:yes stop_codon:yes gene_type:complete